MKKITNFVTILDLIGDERCEKSQCQMYLFLSLERWIHKKTDNIGCLWRNSSRRNTAEEYTAYSKTNKNNLDLHIYFVQSPRILLGSKLQKSLVFSNRNIKSGFLKYLILTFSSRQVENKRIETISNF